MSKLDPITGYPKDKFFPHLETFIKSWRKQNPIYVATLSDEKLAFIHNEMSNVHFDNQIARAKKEFNKMQKENN
tara:strand:+ start:666 stop:887 length:222 start_codon:yes stop_codon:yes gene_type:complete